MLFTTFLHHYLLWHYTQAFHEILHLWKNFVWFIYHFFSITQLTKSFFKPWKRITEGRGRTFNFEDLAGFLIINLISRLLGMLLRTSIITIGLLALALSLVVVILVYLIWLLAPTVILIGTYYGLVLIFF